MVSVNCIKEGQKKIYVTILDVVYFIVQDMRFNCNIVITKGSRNFHKY